MKAKCNKCNKDIECSNEIYRTDKVIVFDDNTCCSGFKAFHKIEEEPTIQTREPKLYFHCGICGDKKNVHNRNEVVKKNQLSKCCRSLDYDIYGISGTSKRASLNIEDKQYNDDLYDSHSEYWNDNEYDNYED